MTARPAANLPLITSSRWIGCESSRGSVPSCALAVDRIEREGQPEQRRDEGDERVDAERDVGRLRAESVNRARKTAAASRGACRRLADRVGREVQRDGRGEAEDDDEHDEPDARDGGRRTPCSPTTIQPARGIGDARLLAARVRVVAVMRAAPFASDDATCTGRTGRSGPSRACGGEVDPRSIARGPVGSPPATDGDPIDVVERRHERAERHEPQARGDGGSRDRRSRTSASTGAGATRHVPMAVRRARNAPRGHVRKRPPGPPRRAGAQVLARRIGSWNPTSTTASSSPNRAASSSTVPCPMSRPAAKMPTRSHTDWTWASRWLESRIGQPALADEATEQVEDLHDAERVDRGRRLVEDQDVGLLDQRIGDARAAGACRASTSRPCRRARSVRPTWSSTSSIVALGLVAVEPVEPRRVAQVLRDRSCRRRSRRLSGR